MILVRIVSLCRHVGNKLRNYIPLSLVVARKENPNKASRRGDWDNRRRWTSKKTYHQDHSNCGLSSVSLSFLFQFYSPHSFSSGLLLSFQLRLSTCLFTSYPPHLAVSSHTLSLETVSFIPPIHSKCIFLSYTKKNLEKI